MLRYAITTFLSAFLLFQVQPLLGKTILPWFGGGPAVWTACLLFFQAVLLAGYAYAHLMARVWDARAARGLHMAFLLVSLAVLPIVPNEVWKPLGDESPVWRILGLLGTTIGVPYFLLATTAPLVQESFRRVALAEPYRLYALSNAGSLLALLSYPLLVEPWLPLRAQAWSWSAGYGLFVAACVAATWGVRGVGGEGVPAAAKNAAVGLIRPRGRDLLFWLALSTCGSTLFLAVTNQISQETAVAPLLWIAPLAIYLVTFIICFERERWYSRAWTWPATAGASTLAAIALLAATKVWLSGQMAIYLGMLFFGCLTCHGELARARPDPRHLTLYYLTIALGGVLGGALVAIVAPTLFSGLWELHGAMMGTCGLAIVAFFRDAAASMPPAKARRIWAVMVTFTALLGAALASHVELRSRGVLASVRNFHGVLRVVEGRDTLGAKLQLLHGQIEHGFQYRDPEKSLWPVSYYAPETGIGLAVAYHPKRENGDGLHIGVIGLGTGTLAILGREQDRVRFYEINPDVVRLSEKYFSYRREALAQVTVELGDARIVLERELAAGRPQRFDVLAMDAFSSDAIPMHLLTSQCAELYAKHLAPDGILCIHISNRYLDLTGVTRAMAEHLGMEARDCRTGRDEERGTLATHWVLLAKNRRFLEYPEVRSRAKEFDDSARPPLVWTDDYGSLLHAVRWKSRDSSK